MTTLTIVSFNLWADSNYRDERREWVCNNVFNDKPDLILLQEVSNSTLLELTETLRRLGYKYKVSNNGRKTFELIGSRWPILHYKFNRYSTSLQRRGIFWADIRVKDVVITVASSQLDQGTLELEKRIGQMDCTLEFLSNYNSTVIFGCDTGFRTGEKYYTDWDDAWVKAGKNCLAEYTLDSHRNKNLIESIQSRPDRIYYKGSFVDPEYQLVGTVAECGPKNVNPSTHFGIKLKLHYQRK